MDTGDAIGHAAEGTYNDPVGTAKAVGHATYQGTEAFG